MKDRSTIVVTLVLLLLVLLALGLRMFRIDGQSLWYDEGFSVYLARMDLGEITARTAADIQPPLYYYLLHGWIQIVGDTERAIRGFSALWGVLTVPLLYLVGKRLFQSHFAGLVAAFLGCISPLHLWYSQEARMYTILTFLCLLSSYLLLLFVGHSTRPSPATDSGDGLREHVTSILLWTGYSVTSIAALYTHYFAFFILGFQGMYILTVWWSSEPRPRQLMIGLLVSASAILMAFAPWLPFVLNRYRADTSYWPGTLKLGEVLLDIAIFFSGGESISEATGVVFAAGWGLVLLLSLIALTVSTPRSSSEAAGDPSKHLVGIYLVLFFLLLYLLLPPALILALSYNSPKFNPRYAMVAHPSLLLLVGGGLSALWNQSSGGGGMLVRRTVAIGALLALASISAYSDVNAYTDARFSRADFRGVADYLNRHKAQDETIILTSGHMFPVFDYYAPGTDRQLLPNSPTLDTTQVLDYSIADSLSDWLLDRGGVWLVLWQDQVVDPAGVLPAILSEAGTELKVDRVFSQIQLRHFRFPDNTLFSDEPNIEHPVDINFGNKLQLLGYSQPDDRQVTLFWNALQPLDEDYLVSLILRDTTGQSWGKWDGRPSAYLYPTSRWEPGSVVFGTYEPALIPGAPPGDYGLEVGVYTTDAPVGLNVLDTAGAPQGTRAMLGAVQLAVTSVTPEEIDIPNKVLFDMGGGLVLQGWELDSNESQPGDRVMLTLFWGTRAEPTMDYQLYILVTDAQGETRGAGMFPPTNVWHPTSTWLPRQAWRGQTTFRIPIQTQPGLARLGVQLVAPDGTTLSEQATITELKVQATDRVFTPPQPQALRQTNFEDIIGLLGADLPTTQIARGSELPLTLYWQSLGETDIPYTVFVHLLGPDGRVVAGQDSQPVNGTRPTLGWVAGEYVADSHILSIPPDLEAGNYVIEVGLYDAGARGMPRLSILGEEGQPEADRVIFGPVQVQ